MTERIYYTDPACREFVATVTTAFVHQGQAAVCLDRTAFYPTSGGQPFDTGTLGNRRVVDVIDDAPRIIHLLDAPLEPGAMVAGSVDWSRRFDHMQQHTGQHILSAALERLTANPTLSFHMGSDVSTIDLANVLEPGDMERVEIEANRIVWDDTPVAIRFVSQEESQRLQLRKESARTGTLRLIDIDGCDLSACGGTHVRRTGAVGVIAITAVERFKGGTRVGFACGRRALHAYGLLRSVVATCTETLAVSEPEVPTAIGRLQLEVKQLRKTVKDLRQTLSGHEAAALLEGAQAIAGVKVIARDLEGYDASALKAMVSAMVGTSGVMVALFTTEEPIQLVIGRSADVEVDASAILRTLTQQYGGKGGGKADLAQGGGLSGDVRQIVWTAAGLLEDACGKRA